MGVARVFKQRKPDDPREEADAQARWVDHVPGLVTDPEETEAPADAG